MKIIGLCGGSGSGKGAVAGIFSEKGFFHIDTDRVYHDLTSRESECLSELEAAFGTNVICDGSLNRRALADMVFSGDGREQRHRLLNEISHRHVINRVREILLQLSSEDVTAALIDAPLLFESGLDRECDAVVSVIADRELRIRRIMARDGLDRDSAIRRIDSQLTDEYLAEHSDYVIVNNGDFSELYNSALAVAEKILHTN